MAAFISAAILAAIWFALGTNLVLIDEVFIADSPAESRRKRKRKERLDSQFKRNVRPTFGPPEISLQPIPVLDRILADPNRNYMQKICHLYAWQFFALAERLKPLIERPRIRPDGTRPIKTGPSCRHDYLHRLFFTLSWLNSGNYYRTTESEVGWGKSSLQEDNKHILIAIMEGLEDQVAWPNAFRRAELALVHDGIFRGMVGIFDIKEHECRKYKNNEKERMSYSAKKKINSWKNLSVMDYTGRFIYVHCALAKNDRDMFTSTPLYMNAGEYFTPGEWMASDGGFEGDGPIRFSYKNPGANEEKKTYNLAFKEVRAGIETAFARVCTWFPLLGNNKQKWNHGDDILQFAVHASARLHNFIVNTENLSYAAATSAENIFKSYY